MKAPSTDRSKQKRRIYFMHTLNGFAAFYVKGGQICYSQQRIPIRLARSLEQIKAEQALSIGWRNRRGFGDSAAEYGYRRVVMP